LTDTFQSWEQNDQQDLDVIPENNERLKRQKQLPIQVIIGNPPYSVGQDSANDENQNEKYPTLDGEIRTTYAARSTATNKNSLYDSYIRAIKWATLRLGDRGIVAFVTNGGFLDSNTADGMRQTLAEEFSAIHVFNLRGNRRQGGAEGRPIWEAFAKGSGGSIATIAIVVLVKRPENSEPATVFYPQVGDFTTATEKVAEVVAAGSISGLAPAAITPNAHGDWLHQRADDFYTFMPLIGIDGVVNSAGPGMQTNRDVWVYNAPRERVLRKMKISVESYEIARRGDRTNDDRKIKWSSSLVARLDRGEVIDFEPAIARANYRPFERSFRYGDLRWIHRPGPWMKTSPTGRTNPGVYVLNPGAEKPFAALMVDNLPDLAFYGSNAGQFCSRWRYEKLDDSAMFDVHEGEVIDGNRRTDNITDEALAAFAAAYPGEPIRKDDIFDYVYGLLHSPEYRETYAADLKKMLPRIPFVADFRAFADAGKQLAELHLGYEAVEPYPLEGLDIAGPGGEADYAFFAVRDKKMAFGKTTPEQKAEGARSDRSILHYNERITLQGIPIEAYRYTLGSRSAIEWIIDRYWVKTDKASGIVNDPNDWSREVGDPRYILDLLARIVTVSLETIRIVDGLPALDIRPAG
jgi:predicted helicase